MQSIRNRVAFVVAGALTLATAACGTDAPTAAAPDADVRSRIDAYMALNYGRPSLSGEDHLHADGFQFVSTGGTLYTYEDGTTASTLNLSRSTSYPVTVLFYDAEEDEFYNACDHNEGGEYYAAQVSTSGRVSYSYAGLCNGSLNASSTAGSGTVQVRIWHTGPGEWPHSDWSSPSIPVSVN